MSSQDHTNENKFYENFIKHIKEINNPQLLENLYKKYTITANTSDIDTIKKLYHYIQTQDNCIDGIYVDRHQNIQLKCDELMLNLAKLVFDYPIPRNENTFQILINAQTDPSSIVQLVEECQKNQRFYFYLSTALTYSIPMILISAILTSHEALLIPTIIIGAIIAIGTYFYTQNNFNKIDNLDHIKNFFENKTLPTDSTSLYLNPYHLM